MKWIFVLLLFVPFCQCAESLEPHRSAQIHESEEIYSIQQEMSVIAINKNGMENFLLSTYASSNLYPLPCFDEPEIAPGHEHFLFKHDWRLPVEWRNPVHKPVPQNVQEDIFNAAALLHFHGYDELMPTYAPKYLQRYYPIEVDDTIFPEAAEGDREQPKLSKTNSRNLFVELLIRNLGQYLSILPIRLREEGENPWRVPSRMICSVKMHESDALYFETPFLVRETRRPYISFFYEVDAHRVYTWLPFIDSVTNATFVVQVWVMNPVEYHNILYKFYTQRLMKAKHNVNKFLNVQVEDYKLEYVSMNEDYKLPMYVIDPRFIRNAPELEDENFLAFKGPLAFDLTLIVKDRFMFIQTVEHEIAIESENKNVKVEFALFPYFNREKQRGEWYRSQIGVLNDFREFFVLPFALGSVSKYVAYIHFDKYGRYYAWIPFTDQKSGKPSLIQVSVQRSQKFAQLGTTEQLFATYGYYVREYIEYLNEPKTPGIKDRRLETTGDYLNLVIAYVPTTCLQQVRDRKWLLSENCESDKWVIHGLWQDDFHIHGKGRRTLCVFRNAWRPGTRIVKTENEVPEGYRNMTQRLSAAFKNDVAYWDYQWCAHGNFMLQENGDPRFENAWDYFETALRLYASLGFEAKINMLQRDNINLQPEYIWTNVYNSFQPPLPAVHATRLHGTNLIAGVNELVFCFDYTTEERVECSNKTKIGAASPVIKNFYYPQTYRSNFDYVCLVLRMTLRRPFLKIKEMIPSFYYYFVHQHYRNERNFLIDAFEQQMLHDTRYVRLLDDLETYWYIQPEYLLQDLKVIFKFSGLVLYQMKKRIQNPMDYFSLVTRIYKNLTRFIDPKVDSLFGYKLGDDVMPEEFKSRFIEANNLSKDKPNVILFCKELPDKSLYFKEILICYSADTSKVISCPIHEYYSRSLEPNEAQKRNIECRNKFRIPRTVEEQQDDEY
ncbi:hypothetical protein B4U80_12862 [Leptotrombidium deliense]|uniref:Uncharacterized protein n=1 Tax=Leptotrombidium deliense TaxID=299467 RepID=A0A443SJ16_9ACAR|nr:hypothetical protein B4U80_12862 [Leptotrombidium deliense]